MKNIIIAMTGASGSIYGIRLLEKLKKYNFNLHLIISKWAKYTIELETNYKYEKIIAKANKHYKAEDLNKDIASGSHKTEAMAVVPCSMKTLSSIANGYSDNLISRAADVCIKEKRKLIIVPRETPLSSIHLENMLKLSNLGVTILPPAPSFYFKPKTIEDMVEFIVNKILSCLGLDIEKDYLKELR